MGCVNCPARASTLEFGPVSAARLAACVAAALDLCPGSWPAMTSACAAEAGVNQFGTRKQGRDPA
jgi:hypothetical protein